MSKQLYASIFQLDGLTLPEIIITRNGVKFNPREQTWDIHDAVQACRFDFSSILNVTEEFLLGFKFALVWFVENKSIYHCQNIFFRFKHFIKIISKDKIVAEITDVDVMNFNSQLNENTRWYLSSLAGFFRKWNSLRVVGVTSDAVNLLDNLRIKGNKKGDAVLTMDPIVGPFTDIERSSLYDKLSNSYLSNEVHIKDYLLCVLFLIFGQRPSQYALLKVCDIKIEPNNDGSFIYILKIPRVKQRESLHRQEFKERILIPQIGKQLYDYSKKVENDFVGILQDPSQAPLFPRYGSDLSSIEKFAYHETANLISLRIKYVYSKLNVISERTGEPLHISSVRFRRTLGTQAAAEGHGPLVIAELLDHSDLQNVGVYVASSPEIIERIDRAVATRLAPLAQAFSGVLVDGESEHDASPSQRIVAPKFSSNFRPVGSCGQFGFCAFAAPIACYTCSSFRAWLDGPHEAILDFLLAERDRLMMTDVRIASVNDRTILAVAQVVEMCKTSQNRQDDDV